MTDFAPFPRAALAEPIPARLAEQVRRHGARPAVVAGDGALTYAALARAASRLAHAMLARDADGPVALLVERGVAQIVALVAALQTGRPCVPMDPDWPTARIEAVLADAGAGLLVGDAGPLAVVRGRTGRSLDTLDVARLDPGLPETPPRGTLDPDAPALVLYTSGSTGRPKGVVHTHATILHNVMKYTNDARLAATDRLSLLSSYAVGAAMSDVFGALLNGATLLPFDVRAHGPGACAAWLDAEGVTVYHSVPTVFRHVCRALHTPLARVRLVKLGGEALTAQDVARFRAAFVPGTRLWNGLGSTECNVIRRLLLDHDTAVEPGIVPVGYAVPDTEVLVVDAAGRPVADGEHGEIVIRGPHLSPGYWRRPDLTAERFATEPDGRRTFRTGDVGRLDADGCLRHLGRLDDQVKVRGNRVEPAEVEGALATHPAVREVAVVAAEGPGGTRLVAHVVPMPAAGTGDLGRVLAEHVACTLPRHMVPATVVIEEALPVGVTGKIDRRALAATHTPAPRRAGAPAVLPGEAALARLVAAVLEVDAVGRHDDFFFDLGGDSLAAAELVMRLGTTLGREVPLSTLAAAPTVARLAALLGENRAGTACLVPIQPGGSRPPLFCVHAVGGHVLSFHDLARALGPDQPLFGLQAPPVPRGTSVAALAARYAAEVDGACPTGPLALAGMCVGGVVAFEMARQLAARGREIRTVFLLDTTRVPRPPRSVGRQVRERLSAAGFGAARLGKLLRRPGEVVRNVRTNIDRTNGRLRRGDWRQDREFTEWTLLLLDRRARRTRRLERALIEAVRAYRPGPYDGRVVHVRAADDDRTGPTVEWDWRSVARGGVDVHLVPGSHRVMMRPPRIAYVARIVREAMPDGIGATVG
jgi:amino acid adenylation domain-containing protein